VKLAINEAQNTQPAFSIVAPRIFDGNSRIDVDVREALESDSAIPNVLRVLLGIEFEQHDYIVSTIKLDCKDGGAGIQNISGRHVLMELRSGLLVKTMVTPPTAAVNAVPPA